MLRNPDSIPAGDTIINDPAMEPYFVVKSTSGGFTVFERIDKSKGGKSYLKTISYPSNFSNALKTVAKELLHSETTQYNSVKEYLQRWDEITERMQSITTLE